MILNLFPTHAGVWSLGLPPSFDQALYESLLKVHAEMKAGEEIWHRRDHDIFDGSVPIANELVRLVMPKISEFIGPNGRVISFQGREVVRNCGVEIMPHADEDECHLQAVYFPVGPELDKGGDFIRQVNAYGPNAFAICNPDWRSSGFGAFRMPWETPSKFWIAPHRGLLIAFDARAVHFQKPYHGEAPFLQVLLNIKVERING